MVLDQVGRTLRLGGWATPAGTANFTAGRDNLCDEPGFTGYTRQPFRNAIDRQERNILDSEGGRLQCVTSVHALVHTNEAFDDLCVAASPVALSRKILRLLAANGVSEYLQFVNRPIFEMNGRLVELLHHVADVTDDIE
ncbi:hypothetical protein CHY08_22675 (plasmid) [Rhizobium leguminosarum bv. viciae]|uniref:hypothetical protein n=1 Tax=Rhizobium leguminosarum TaxID=384 RepID=UPI000B8CEF20|nr:hypothetical protein [Rhizobium leguminosarum]ASR09917.1 hypothetical protein CHY08_22675 [Rhizobium leguminosarum bv. viciae]